MLVPARRATVGRGFNADKTAELVALSLPWSKMVVDLLVDVVVFLVVELVEGVVFVEVEELDLDVTLVVLEDDDCVEVEEEVLAEVVELV